MKSAMHATLLAVALGCAVGNAPAADYGLNPYTLAYEGELTRNVAGEVNIHQVSYVLDGIQIAANVYAPAN